MPAKPFSVPLASALGASRRLGESLSDCIAIGTDSPLVVYREAADILRAIAPHVARISALLAEIDAKTSRSKRRPLTGA